MMNAAMLITATACWAAAIYKIYQTMRQGAARAPLFAVSGSLALLALAITLQIPAVVPVVDRNAVPHTAQVASHALLLSGTACSQRVITYILGSSPYRTTRTEIKRLSILIVAVGIMLTTFLTAPPDHLLHGQTPAPTLSAAIYFGAYSGYIGFISIDMFALSFRYSRVANRTLLRTGMHFNAAAGIVGAIYAATKIAFLLAHWAATNTSTLEDIMINGLACLAALLVAIGTTLPAWGPRLGLDNPTQWLARYRSYLALYSLWFDLYQAEPAIALIAPANRLIDMANIADLRFRLYRRVIEIRDGLLALREYFDPAVQKLARQTGSDTGLAGQDLDDLVEATLITVALRDKTRGAPPTATLTKGPQVRGDDLDSEAEILRRIANARTSPLVNRIVNETERDSA